MEFCLFISEIVTHISIFSSVRINADGTALGSQDCFSLLWSEPILVRKTFFTHLCTYLHQTVSRFLQTHKCAFFIYLSSEHFFLSKEFCKTKNLANEHYHKNNNNTNYIRFTTDCSLFALMVISPFYAGFVVHPFFIEQTEQKNCEAQNKCKHLVYKIFLTICNFLINCQKN